MTTVTGHRRPGKAFHFQDLWSGSTSPALFFFPCPLPHKKLPYIMEYMFITKILIVCLLSFSNIFTVFHVWSFGYTFVRINYLCEMSYMIINMYLGMWRWKPWEKLQKHMINQLFMPFLLPHWPDNSVFPRALP